MSGLVAAAGDLRRIADARALVGGKAAGLLNLLDAAADVPPFVVVTTDAWRAGDDGTRLPDGVVDTVMAAGLAPPWAVRSSAVVEDAATGSWAGQFESVLGVNDRVGLEAAILRCWASGRSDRVRAYGEQTGHRAGAMAVIVQSLIVGEASGVLFSRDPDDPDRAILSVGLGLGEGVVQGRVPCDTFRVDANDAIEATIDAKDEEVVPGPDGPTVRAVETERQLQPAISDDVVLALVRAGRDLERRAGAPVDVEFTVAGGRPVLLQVRPIAVRIPVGRRLLWDNSNIVESYDGITTPLTFSFASRAYTIVYQLFCRVMGVDDETIRANEPVFRRMIGLVHGRIYYNLNAWYRVLQLLPGFSFNRRAMETMMGVGEVAGDEDTGQPPPRWKEGLRLARLGSRLGWRLWMLERDATAFQATFRETLAKCKAVDLDRLRLDELLELYEDIERKLLWAWTPPLVNDFFCMIFYKVLQRRCQELTADPATDLHHRLLAGEGTLASAAPAVELLALADVIRTDSKLKEVLASDRPEADVLAAARLDPAFRERYDGWLDRYGDRSPNELLLEAPTLRDTPGFVLGTLRGFVREGAKVHRFGEEERVIREAAEREVAGRLRGPIAKAVFGFVLRQARRRVALRESLRFERTRIFGFVRELFRAFGRRYAEAGAIAEPSDVFLLTVDEILGFVRGTTPTTDLRGLVEVRRRELEAHKAGDAPAERFYTWGAVHVANRFRGRPRAAAPTGDVLEGTPCAPGRVEAVAKVVKDPRETPDLGGAILVANRTDPGWVPLYPTASGLLVERGSLLSHSAVVARELGLPAIIGVRGLLDWVKDGEVLVMDGGTGRIERRAAKEVAGG